MTTYKLDLRRIESLDCSVRFYNTCKAANIKTVHTANKILKANHGKRFGRFYVTKGILRELNEINLER